MYREVLQADDKLTSRLKKVFQEQDLVSWPSLHVELTHECLNTDVTIAERTTIA